MLVDNSATWPNEGFDDLLVQRLTMFLQTDARVQVLHNAWQEGVCRKLPSPWEVRDGTEETICVIAMDLVKWRMAVFLNKRYNDFRQDT